MTKIRDNSIVLISGLAVASAVLPVTTYAENVFIEEVLVTARKTEESAQVIPVAITALSSDMLMQMGANDIMDIGAQTPNLNITSAAAGNTAATNFNMRGQIQNDNLITLDPSVGLYIDDIYVARSFGGVLDLVDIERIEVLRGPQGTLYGRNTTGGAIKVVSKKADPEAGVVGGVRAEIGNYNSQKYTAYVNLPLADDLAVRYSGMWKDRDGYETAYIYDPLGNFEGTDEADTDTGYAHRLNMTWLASDNLTIYSSADWFRSDEIGKVTLSQAGDLGGGGAQFGGYPTGFSPEHKSDFYSSRTNHLPAAISEGGGISFTIDHQLGDDLAQKLVVAYREVKSDFGRFDADGTDLAAISSHTIQEQDQTTLEYQLQGSAFDNKLAWTTGLYYFEEEGEDSTLSVVFGGPSGNLGTAKNTSKSVFVNGNYTLTEKLGLSAGIRHTEDEKELVKSSIGAGGVCILPSGGSECIEKTAMDDSFQSWSVAMDYQLSDAIFTYAKVSEASRSGGLQLRAVGLNTPPLPFGRETALEYELGFKSDFLDNSLRLNVAIFRNDYSDVQFSSIMVNNLGGPTVVVVNLSDAVVEGYEVELVYAMTEALTLQATYGHNETDFDDDSLVRAYTPEDQRTLAVNYVQAIGTGIMRARLGYTYASEMLTDEDKTQYALPLGQYLNLDSHSELSARLGYEFDNGVNIALWGKNLTDEEYWARGIQVVAANTPAQRGAPRTYGIAVGYDF